jgi:hypothetical protein
LPLKKILPTGKLPSWANPILSRDGKTLMCGSSVVDLETNLAICTMQEKTDHVWATAISSDCSLIAGGIASKDGTQRELAIWETATGKSIERWQNPGWDQRLLLHPNPRFVVIASRDGMVLYNLASGNKVRTFSGPEQTRAAQFQSIASSAAIAPDGKRLVTGHADGTILTWKIDLPSPSVPGGRPSAKAIENAWIQLINEDAATAWQAVWRLTDWGDEALPFLKSVLKPAAPVVNADGKITAKLIADLESDKFAVRSAAGNQLQSLGVAAEAALQTKLSTNPPLETKRRIEIILGDIASASARETVRDLRAVAVLANIQAPASRSLLEELSKGLPKARLTRAAAAALATLPAGLKIPGGPK